MSAIDPSQATRTGVDAYVSRRWRRRQIIATYASYAVVIISEIVRAHVSLEGSARSVLALVFFVAVIAFFVSLAWLVAPSVRYGTSEGTKRSPGIAALRDLRAQGVSAAAAYTMFSRPPDERQRAILEHARAVAYRIIGPIIGAFVFYLVIVPQVIPHTWVPTTELEQVLLFLGFALLYSTLPAAVIAWREPDPVPDDRV